MVRAEESLVGRTLAGKFLIERHLGSGAMGQVYRARQIALEKTVAVKVLHPSLAHDEMFAARFQREAMAASRLDHPNSMRVLDFGTEPDGLLYIAMEYLDGRDLLRVIGEDAPLPESRSVDILIQTLSALVVAHDMGVVHRDMKPENIMMLESVDDEGNRVDVVKVCDFGIAKINGKTLAGAASDSARGPLTTQGLVVGTPEYMSPEQGMGNPLDARSDLYSVGVILFQLIVGRLPFEAETALGIVFKQVNEPPPVPSVLQPGVSPVLESICLRALAKRPEDRFQSAREMRAALRAFSGVEISRNPSGSISAVRSGSRALEQAETVGLTASEIGSFRPPGAPPVSAPNGTSGGMAVLPPLPVTPPSVWVLAILALLIGAGSAGFFVLHSSSGAKHIAAATPMVATPPAIPSVDSAVVDPMPVASASAAPAVSAVAGGSAGAALRGRSASTTVYPPSMTPAASPPVAVKVASSTGSDVEGGFSLATSAASPSVESASGIAARDVRGALPSWKFTECYRSALTHTKTALAGHVKLTLSIEPNGSVSRVLSQGPAALLEAAGTCMTGALADVTMPNVTSVAAKAVVDIDCAPR